LQAEEQKHLDMSCHPSLNVVCVVHEYSKPVCSNSTQHDASEDICEDAGVHDCTCNYSVSHIVPMLALQCHTQEQNRACACTICNMFRSIGKQKALAGVTRIYCACTLVVKNAYVLYDYSSVVFKLLYNDTKFSEPKLNSKLESLVFDVLNHTVKQLLIAKMAESFEMGVGRRNEGQAQGRKTHMLRLETNTLAKHVSMRGAMYTRRNCNDWMQRAKLVHEDATGNIVSMTVSNESLDRDDVMLLDRNEQFVWLGSQYSVSDVSGGSIVNMVEGEIRVAFPSTLVLHRRSKSIQRHGRGGVGRSVAAGPYVHPHDQVVDTPQKIPLLLATNNMWMKLRLDTECQHIGWSGRVVVCSLETRLDSTAKHTSFNPDVAVTIYTDGDNRASDIATRANAGAYFNSKYDCCLPHCLSLFLRENSALVQASADNAADQYLVGEPWKDLTRLPRNDKYLMVMMLGTSTALEMLQGLCQHQGPATTESIFSVTAVYFSIHTALKTIYDLCFDIILKILMVSTGESGWECANISVLLDKLYMVDQLIQIQDDDLGDPAVSVSQLGKRNAPVDATPSTALQLLGSHVVRSTRIIARMHPHARAVLVSEMLGDVVYIIFFGGQYFTYCAGKCTQQICARDSELADIQSELQHRLGFLPALCTIANPYTLTKQEQIRRTVMHQLMHNDVVFNHGTNDKDIYAYRNKIAYMSIADDTTFTKLVRSFKNATRQHHSHVLHAANEQSFIKFKQLVSDFLHSMQNLVATKCSSLLYREFDKTVTKKANLVTSLHRVCQEIQITQSKLLENTPVCQSRRFEGPHEGPSGAL